MQKYILIYDNRDMFQLEGLQAELKQFFEPYHIQIRLTNADEIIRKRILQIDTLALVMPGGAAAPYAQALGDEGNKRIRDYTLYNGVYLGICAGAYYACQRTIFEKGKPWAMRSTYGLNLVKASAIGSLSRELGIPPYSKDVLSETVVPLFTASGKSAVSFYHGGPYFKIDKSEKNVQVLATYARIPGNKPAIISKKMGDGEVLLSGVHIETTPEHLRRRQHTEVAHTAHTMGTALLLSQYSRSRQRLFQHVMQHIREHI